MPVMSKHYPLNDGVDTKAPFTTEEFGTKITIRNGTTREFFDLSAIAFELYKWGLHIYIKEIIYDKKSALGFIILQEDVKVASSQLDLFKKILEAQDLDLCYRAVPVTEEEWNWYYRQSKGVLFKACRLWKRIINRIRKWL